MPIPDDFQQLLQQERMANDHFLAEDAGDEFSPMVLRITQIYRREEGKWRVIHRHGDPITDKKEVEALLS